MMRWMIMIALLALVGTACAGSVTVDDAARPDGNTTAVDSVESPSSPASTAASTSVDDPASSTTESGSTVVTNAPKGTEPTSPTTSPANPNGSIDPGLAPLVGLAKADLGDRLGVDPAAIALISAELVEWPDTSLGCPQPGMAYTQIPTDGSLIVLAHDSVEYRYHTGGSASTPFLCE